MLFPAFLQDAKLGDRDCFPGLKSGAIDRDAFSINQKLNLK